MHGENTNSIGLIYSESKKGVGSTEFNFTVKENKIRKFDYVTAPHKEGYILAQVMDIKRYGDFGFDEASNLEDADEIRKIKTHVAAFADVIGYRDEKNLLQSPRTPFNVGTYVRQADPKLIQDVLGLCSDRERGAYLGMLKGIELPVYLNVDSLVQKHVCILAKTGAGKSYAGGVLVEELLKKKVPLVIIDTHGEYMSLASKNLNKKDKKSMDHFGVGPREYSNQISVYSPLGSKGDMKHLTMHGVSMGAREILDILPGKLSGPQVGVLYQAVKEVKEYKENYTLQDIIEAVNRSKSNARWNVIASLESLISTGLFTEGGVKPSELVRSGKCTIINMKGVTPDVQDVIVARLTKVLFEDRKLGKVPPFLFFIEEAHNYCPERGFGSTVSLTPLRTIAAEGRKFGMGLCIVSQRPAKVDKNIVSQCNTNIILKVTNPNDLKAIVSSVEGLTSKTAEEIQRLPIGIALISGASIQIPIMTEIRTRETKHGGQSVKVFKEKNEPETTTKELKFNPIEHTEITPPPSPENMSGNPKKREEQAAVTKKAKEVHLVANRLGWISTTDPNDTMEQLTVEAEKMNENVFKYLESLAALGRKFCHETAPDCIHCPMSGGCNYRAKMGSSKTKKSKFLHK